MLMASYVVMKRKIENVELGWVISEPVGFC